MVALVEEKSKLWRRRSHRLVQDAAISLVRGREIHAVGELIDISRDGAAFRAFSRVEVGEIYTIIVTGLVSTSARVVRRFDIDKYAVEFLVGEKRKMEIGKKIQNHHRENRNNMSDDGRAYTNIGVGTEDDNDIVYVDEEVSTLLARLRHLEHENRRLKDIVSRFLKLD